MCNLMAIIVIALKFFSIINLSWTSAILFAIAFILIDLSKPVNVANINYVRYLEDEVDNLKDSLSDLKYEVEDLKTE